MRWSTPAPREVAGIAARPRQTRLPACSGLAGSQRIGRVRPVRGSQPAPTEDAEEAETTPQSTARSASARGARAATRSLPSAEPRDRQLPAPCAAALHPAIAEVALPQTPPE